MLCEHSHPLHGDARGLSQSHLSQKAGEGPTVLLSIRQGRQANGPPHIRQPQGIQVGQTPLFTMRKVRPHGGRLPRQVHKICTAKAVDPMTERSLLARRKKRHRIRSISHAGIQAIEFSINDLLEPGIRGSKPQGMRQLVQCGCIKIKLAFRHVVLRLCVPDSAVAVESDRPSPQGKIGYFFELIPQTIGDACLTSVHQLIDPRYLGVGGGPSPRSSLSDVS